MNKKWLLGLLSLSLLAMEISWTRLFSAEFFYTFAFLILSLAILGMGLGALTVRLYPTAGSSRIQPIWLLLTGVFMLLSPIIIIQIAPDFTHLLSSVAELTKVIATILLLACPYYFGGIVIAAIFRDDVESLNTLYMADLLGAAAGIVIIVFCMNILGTPSAILTLPIIPLILSFRIFKSRMKILPAILIFLPILLVLLNHDLLTVQRNEPVEVIYTHWDANAKIKIYDYDNGAYRRINIDNAANSPVYGFDGTFPLPDSLRDYSIDVGNLIRQFDNCRFLSLGAGGGTDVFQALDYGAKDIYAVEVIPYINEMMTEGDLADFSGNIYSDPRVHVITEDGRAFIRRYENYFDIIYSLSSNTFAALASGSFALAENYLFTTEAFEDYWRALSSDGYMMMEHQFFIPRIVSQIIPALEKAGVSNPEAHFAVYDLPKMRRKMLLLSKQELTSEVLDNAFGSVPDSAYNVHPLLYPVPEDSTNLIAAIVRSGWKSAAADSPTDISPCYDNRPFVAQQGLMKNISATALQKILPYEFFGFPLAKLIILAIIAIAAIIFLPLTLIPYLKKGIRHLPIPAYVYFFGIGMAFMMVEVTLIQQYTLLIGSGIYPLITVLITLLGASALGSRHSKDIPVAHAVLIIAGWLLLNSLLFKTVAGVAGLALIGWRIAAAILMIIPLGFYMGVPFPRGGNKAGELVDWGFAVNGVASVIGSALALLIAFNFGYTAVYLSAAILYLAAGWLYEKHSW